MLSGRRKVEKYLEYFIALIVLCVISFVSINDNCEKWFPQYNKLNRRAAKIHGSGYTKDHITSEKT